LKRSLKLILALVALQLFAAPPAPAGAAAAHDSETDAWRPTMTQRRSKKVRKHAADALTPGAWGGRHISLTVTETGARVEYDCAHGTVEGKIDVDAQGRFNVYGRHFEEHGGPVRADEIREEGEGGGGYRVRLSGRVGGSLMKLTVTRTDTREVIGTFDLARDRDPVITKCR
jgi:hypothetical protein